ncbi:MAG TPA: molybdenum cofactor biosynthesis protein MoaE [Dehalococcoidia bacterium]|nr:molybdenum cofactor biosynthesis protein MoaE [Dehalococcoidia bacterium]
MVTVSSKANPMFAVTPDVLDEVALSALVAKPEAGAIVLFSGIVRDNNLGRRVEHLEYDAYPPLAERTLVDIAAEARSRWDLTEIAIHHRIGRLEIGEASLLVAVSSSHRAEAFTACQYCVDRVKQIVPVWKKEVWEGGESWIEGTPVSSAQVAPSTGGH